MLCDRGKIRRSTSILGILFDSIRIDQLMDSWRASYGGASYAFRAIHESGRMPPDPLLEKDPGHWLPLVPRAKEILDRFFDERQKLLEVSKGCGSEKDIILDTQQQLFSNCATDDDF